LEEAGIIVESKKIGVARLYKLNEDNEITKAFVELYRSLLVKMVDEEEDKLKVVA